LAQLPPRRSRLSAPRRQALPDRHERAGHPSHGTPSVGPPCALAGFRPDCEAPSAARHLEVGISAVSNGGTEKDRLNHLRCGDGTPEGVCVALTSGPPYDYPGESERSNEKTVDRIDRGRSACLRWASRAVRQFEGKSIGKRRAAGQLLIEELGRHRSLRECRRRERRDA